jgi:hypothetical protein
MPSVASCFQKASSQADVLALTTTPDGGLLLKRFQKTKARRKKSLVKLLKRFAGVDIARQKTELNAYRKSGPDLKGVVVIRQRDGMRK